MFKSQVHITFRKNAVSFEKDGHSFDLKPVVYLDHNEPPIVLSVGTPPEGQIASRAVHLFDGADYDDKVLIFEVLVRYGLKKILGKGFRLAPEVTFEVAPEVIALMGGYHRLVLHYCATMGGARSTPFGKRYGKM